MPSSPKMRSLNFSWPCSTSFIMAIAVIGFDTLAMRKRGRSVTFSIHIKLYPHLDEVK